MDTGSPVHPRGCSGRAPNLFQRRHRTVGSRRSTPLDAAVRVHPRWFA